MEILKAVKVKENVNGATVIIADRFSNFGEEWLVGIIYEENLNAVSINDICGIRHFNKTCWNYEEVLARFAEYIDLAKHNYIFG